MSTPPMAPSPIRPQRSNTLLIVLAVLGVGLLVLVIGGVFVASYVLRGLRVEESGKRVEIHTPVGDIKVKEANRANVGLPIYPGATLVKPGKGVEVALAEEHHMGVIAVKYTTPDSLEEVDAWYHAQLGPEFERQGPGEKHILAHGHGVRVTTDEIVYVAESGSLARVVAFGKKGDVVEIALIRAGEQEAQ